MPQRESPEILVARFLRSNNYQSTLDAFLREAKLSEDAGQQTPHALTIETILHEKSMYDLAQSFEKVGEIKDDEKGWSGNAPNHGVAFQTLAKSPMNVLSVGVLQCENSSIFTCTTADRRIYWFSNPDSSGDAEESTFTVMESPVLALTQLTHNHAISSSMSGQIAIHDLSSPDRKIISQRRDHSKYVVRVSVFAGEDAVWLATAGWDQTVLVYRISTSRLASLDGDGCDGRGDGVDNDSNNIQFGEPVAKVMLQTNPECIQLIRHPEMSTPVLLLTRRDSTYLYYYAMPETTATADLVLLSRQNLAPHSNSWVAFTPSSFAICPTDHSLVAVATSHQPHMKLIIVRLLLPPPTPAQDTLKALPAHFIDPTSTVDLRNTPLAVSEARAAVALQDREAKAILVQVSTLAPQDAFSTPVLAWRSDGTGVWTNGDDGAIRGIEAESGKIVQVLKDGHESGIKIRCLWAGVSEGVEYLLSGGFDRQMIIWRHS